MHWNLTSVAMLAQSGLALIHKHFCPDPALVRDYPELEVGDVAGVHFDHDDQLSPLVVVSVLGVFALLGMSARTMTEARHSK